MKANPGGNLDPDCVYGRENLINILWERLESQSILINAERRIGKTQILRKMQIQPQPGWKPLFKVLERVHSAHEFAELVYDDVQQFLGSTTRAKNFIQKVLEDNETDYINLKSRSWKQLLSAAISDLMKAPQKEKLVFLWDEVPWMLESIARNNGLNTAAEVLDTLRSLRIEHNRFRVVLTGSIGLHHVLGKLSAAGIPTSATNDLYAITVPPLSPSDASRLAADLLQGENILCDDRQQVAETIASQVDGFPYYIHHVVAGLRLEQSIATPASIRRHIESQLVNAADPWQLTHYRTRLPTYYPNPDDARNVTAILDALATNSTPENPLSINQLLQLAPPHINGQHDREDLLRLLRLMDADHYISRNTSGGFHFRFPLIQRWWKLERGL